MTEDRLSNLAILSIEINIDQTVDFDDVKSRDYPKTIFGKQNRSFSSNFFKLYTWLEYSVKRDAVYCFCCRLFGKNNDDIFTKIGFKNWKKISGSNSKQSKLASHALTKEHLTNLSKMTGYYSTKSTGRNFQEMCSFFSKYDSEFNRMFTLCSQNVKDTIFSEIKETGFFSIMCDDARCHKEEQMSICVRYTKKFEVFERFLGFIDVSQKQDAESAISAILNFLEQSNIQNVPIVAQSYDGAAVMSGKRAGVQTKLKEYYPSAIYVHCMAHRVNLVVIDISLYVHFSRPSTNFKLKEMQNKLNIKTTTLMAISDTRWVCRIQNCDAVYNNFEVLIEVLNDEVDLNKDMDVAQAIGLLSSIQKASFIIYLIILQDVLKVINILSNQLQKKTSTLGEAANIIFGVIQTFENYRSSNKFSEIWSKITNFAEKHNIPIETPSRGSNSKCKRKESTYLRDYCTSTTTGNEYSEFDESSLNISD
ncbi:zinc finger MYM-type protein 1-like [Acyrthosiphon pisum]|uniref:TTF-type domain-containing protein n=1 Tax=Acyrthosiphon pisum TaxID=7029 RepID=A0A8R1WXQ9_ACYPI|nr:zinc finger MYM-type protein 1-like [Acyrthosiphon pisum]|eukprot:XP_008178588.1 PREDICTED: zinc finger MYM-type protein 1-like [Acyrthosiphon pisum]